MPSIPKWINDAFENLLSSKFPLVEVTNTEYFSPSVKKICLKGDFKKLDFQIGYYIEFRVNDTEYRRYMISHGDSENGFMEIIAHLHGEAPAVKFLHKLMKGSKAIVIPPRGNKWYNESVVKQLIFGDETSLSLACSFLPVLKKNKHQFQFYFELDEENKEVPELLGLENYTIYPKNGSFRNEKWVGDLPIFKTADWQNANFVLTGNVKSVQTFRKVLKNTATGKIFSKGFWLEGKNGL